MIKISGESLSGDSKESYDIKTIDRICADIKEVYDMGVELCVVIGGGNICRGAQISKIGIERTNADYMGMLATVMNAIAIRSSLERLEVSSRIQSAITMTSICEPYIRYKALRHLNKNRIVIFASGTGNPYFTTDTASVLRAAEMNCDLIIKCTNVDGVYSKDPKKFDDAQLLHSLTYKDVINKDLGVMDMAAIALAGDNKIPLVVFNIKRQGGLAMILQNKGEFTLIN